MDIQIIDESQAPPMPKAHTWDRVPAKRRHKRFNARGDVWCNKCQQYLPAHRFRFVSYPSMPKPKYWAYCNDCVRVIDRERYAKATSTLAGAERVLADRYKRKEKYRKHELADRAAFVDMALDTLQRRGFTYADICKLMGTSHGTLIQWREHRVRIVANVAKRFGVILLATAHIPTGERVIKGRRKANPHLPGLIAHLEPELARYPLRNAWSSGKRRKNAESGNA